MPPRRRNRRRLPSRPTGPRPAFNAILKSSRCPRCDSQFKTTPPSGRIGYHAWDCSCGGSLIVAYDGGEWCWYFNQRFVVGDREWRLEYRSADRATEFWYDPGHERDPEIHLLPTYVSHERFAKLIPFL